MRNNPIEQEGVFSIGKIFSREFGWIFREQPIVDVGIDALVEQSTDGEPQAKFIALQIKSGKGNFYITENNLTYYISNIHYNYWLKFDIPVILVGYLPETEKAYWIEIKDRNIKRTKKQWRIEIPFKNELNLKTKPKIIELLSDSDYEYQSIKIFNGEDLDEATIFDIAEKANCISDSKESTIKTIQLLEELAEKTNISNKKFQNYNEIGQSFKSPQVIASVKTYAKNIHIYSKRLESECEIFSETFGEGIFAYEQAIMIHFLVTNDVVNVRESIKSVENIPNALDSAISGVEFMRNSLSQLPDNYKELKESKKIMLSVIDLIINEYKEAKLITINLIESSNELLKKNRSNRGNLALEKDINTNKLWSRLKNFWL